MQLQWTDPATQDLDRIEEYVSIENSPIVAIDIVLRVIETVENILLAHPRAGQIGRGVSAEVQALIEWAR